MDQQDEGKFDTRTGCPLTGFLYMGHIFAYISNSYVISEGQCQGIGSRIASLILIDFYQ
jgi:hypothetical protein